MERKEYSAGAVELSYWFIEFRKVVELLHEGKNAEQIKSLCPEREPVCSPDYSPSQSDFHTVTGHQGFR